MYRRTTSVRWLALLAAFALILVACAGEDPDTDPVAGDDGTDEPGTDEPDTDEDAGEGPETASGGEFTIHNCEPRNLIPGNSTEVCGSKVLDQLFSGLVEYDAETQEPVNVVAESIESDDAQNWTITIRDDFTFHNGEPVTAHSFVDAWNFTANPDNAMANAFFFQNFVGYAEVAAGEADTMSGLEAVDDTTITISLTEPFSVFPIVVGYTGFYPLPSVALEDIQAFNEAPIGNGRYMMEGVWEHDQQIRMVRFEEWAGEGPGLADAITWQIYSDVNTAYNDVLAGGLDILDSIPPEREVSVEGDFGPNLLRTQTSTFTYLGFPVYQEAFQDVNLRRAISMAIDRQAIIDAIFSGARTPARSLIAPVLPQHRSDACEFCEFDPERARELLEDAGGWEGPMTLWLNSGAGHEDWMEAVAGQLRQNLGIEEIEFESLEFAQYLELHGNDAITGPYRLGWVLSYPSPQYALGPLYTTTGSSNNFGYSNADVDDFYARANAASTLEEADALYLQAEDQILADMPLAPMWFETRTSVFTDNVGDVLMDARTFIRVERVSVNS
jgi:peptide/nickel transport system substrate-binding protein/oligopeptide transport system substrate-binding protein